MHRDTTMRTQFFTAVILFMLGYLNASNTELPGHLQRLGMQKEKEGHVDILKELPSPSEFFEKYVKPGRPAVFKGAAKKMPAFKNWDDEYLKTKFGHLKYDVEEGKKENKSLRTFTHTMKYFIDNYKKTDVYMVDNIQKEMREDVTLLPTMSCGGYVNLLHNIVLWFSSGGTSSVLHADYVDNINCVFSGEKEFYMVDKHHGEFIDFDAPNGGYSKVDPLAVDLEKYPGLAKAPWWEAKVEAGDCLFSPLNWYHQVRSHNRNIAVNFWFMHPLKINESDCEGKEWKDQYTPLIKYKLKSNEVARQLLALEVKDKGKISRTDFIPFLMKSLQAERSEIREVINLVDKNGDKFITMEDIDALTEKELTTVRQLMPMGADLGEGDADPSVDPSGDDLPPEDDYLPAEGEGNPADDDAGDGFPEDEESESGDSSNEYSRTEL